MPLQTVPEKRSRLNKKAVFQHCRFCRRLTPYIVEFTSLGLHCKRTASLNKGRAFQKREKPDRWPVRGQARDRSESSYPTPKLRRIFSNLAKYSKQIKGNNTVVEPFFALLHPGNANQTYQMLCCMGGPLRKILNNNQRSLSAKNLHTDGISCPKQVDFFWGSGMFQGHGTFSPSGWGREGRYG